MLLLNSEWYRKLLKNFVYVKSKKKILYIARDSLQTDKTERRERCEYREKAVKFVEEGKWTSEPRDCWQEPRCKWSSAFSPGFFAMREGKPATYSRAWRRKQVWWRRSGRGSGASKRRRTQRGPSASSRAVGEPRRPAGILVPPIAPAGTLSRPWNT